MADWLRSLFGAATAEQDPDAETVSAQDSNPEGGEDVGGPVDPAHVFDPFAPLRAAGAHRRAEAAAALGWSSPAPSAEGGGDLPADEPPAPVDFNDVLRARAGRRQPPPGIFRSTESAAEDAAYRQRSADDRAFADPLAFARLSVGEQDRILGARGLRRFTDLERSSPGGAPPSDFASINE